MNDKDKELSVKVHSAMYALIKEKGVASPAEVLMAVGALSKEDYENWRFGRVPYLERVCRMNLRKLSLINHEIRVYARKNNLKPSWSDYRKWGNVNEHERQFMSSSHVCEANRNPISLRFSKSGDDNVEKLYATHYVSQHKVAEAMARREFQKRKDELARTIAPCGLICGLCSENQECRGCRSGDCGHDAECYQRKCCSDKGIKGCWKCPDFPCENGMFSPNRDVRLRAFVRCAKEDGPKALAGYILRNQDSGILYHRGGQNHTGDYDGLDVENAVLELLRKGKTNNP